MKLFSNVDSAYMTKADYKHLSRHNQPVARGPNPWPIVLLNALTIAAIFGAPLIWALLK